MERICPRDGSNLASTVHREVHLDICNACGGVWVDSDQLSRVLGVEDPYVVVDLLREAPSSDHAANRCPLCGRRTRGNARVCPNCSVCLLSDCPSCATRLKVVDVHGCPIDVCPCCFGVWFDSEEVMAVRAELVKLGIGVRGEAEDGLGAANERRAPGEEQGEPDRLSGEIFAVDEATDATIESTVSFDAGSARGETGDSAEDHQSFTSCEVAVDEAVDAAIEEQVSFGDGPSGPVPSRKPGAAGPGTGSARLSQRRVLDLVLDLAGSLLTGRRSSR